MPTATQQTTSHATSHVLTRPMITVSCEYKSMFEEHEAAQFDTKVTVAGSGTVSTETHDLLCKVQKDVQALLNQRRDELVAGFQSMGTLPDPRAWHEQWTAQCADLVQRAIQADTSATASEAQHKVQVTGRLEEKVEADALLIEHLNLAKLSSTTENWEEITRLGKTELERHGGAVTPREKLLLPALESTKTDCSLFEINSQGSDCEESPHDDSEIE